MLYMLAHVALGLSSHRPSKARAMWDSTLVVFASDNGGAINQQGSNKPLRGGKKGRCAFGAPPRAPCSGGGC